MKVQIRDKEAMDSLTVADLRAYLEAHGWSNERPWGTWATILSKEGSGKIWEVAVPNEAGGLLYAESVAEIIATLAEAEDRSQLDVFYDLANSEINIVPQDGSKRVGTMVSVWRVGADKGDYTDHFVTGGYAAAGWIRSADLTEVTDREEFRQLYKKDSPQDNDGTVNTNVGQIYRFMVEIKPGDYILTPTADNALQRYGRVVSGPCYVKTPIDGCPFPHRRKVDWADQPVNISDFSRPLHNALKFGKLTVFEVRHREEFLTVIGPRRKMLEQLLKIDDEKEFEMLIGTALKHKGWKIAK